MKRIISKKLKTAQEELNPERESVAAQVRGHGDSLGFYGKDLEFYVQDALKKYDEANLQDPGYVDTDHILNATIQEMERDFQESEREEQAYADEERRMGIYPEYD